MIVKNRQYPLTRITPFVKSLPENKQLSRRKAFSMSEPLRNKVGLTCLTLSTIGYIVAGIGASVMQHESTLDKSYFLISLFTLAGLQTIYLVWMGIQYSYERNKIATLINEAVPRKHIPNSWKRMVRDGCRLTCTYCDKKGTHDHDADGNSWHYDHCIPISKGGITHPHNLTLSCATCNLSKGNKTPIQFIHYLRRKHT